MQISHRHSYITMGANVESEFGGPQATLEAALRLFAAESLKIAAQSSWYKTPAFPAGSGPDFVNAVVKVKTDLGAAEILAALHRIEQTLGRQRHARWAARSCDLDLLDSDGLVLPDAATWQHWHDLPIEAQKTTAPTQLILPHPRIQDRAFVLVPLSEIAPDWRHPVLQMTASQMLGSLPTSEIAQILPISPE